MNFHVLLQTTAADCPTSVYGIKKLFSPNKISVRDVVHLSVESIELTHKTPARGTSGINGGYESYDPIVFPDVDGPPT